MFFIVYQNRRRSMRKNLVRAVIVLATIVVVGGVCLYASGCSPQRRWNEEQRREAREMLREWREIAYLNALTEAEFDLFSAEVADVLEERWPSYVEFIEMPMVGDSVEVVVVAAIVSDIKANANNMRRLFPYDTLVSSACGHRLHTEQTHSGSDGWGQTFSSIPVPVQNRSRMQIRYPWTKSQHWGGSYPAEPCAVHDPK